MQKENILITGSNGFIGGHTFKNLEKKRFQVHSFDGDILQAKDWQNNLKGGEILFLIAGKRTETAADLEANAKYLDLLFDVMNKSNNKPNKIILASSQAVYMGNTPPFKESGDPKPTTFYGKSKLLSEELLEKYCNQYGIPYVILRYSTVLGSGVREQSKMSGPLFFWTNAAKKGDDIKVFQDGNQTRDYVHIDDVVASNILAINLPNGIYNVGGGKSIEVIKVAKWIKKATNSSSEIKIVGGEASSSDPRIMFSDISKISKLGWKPKRSAKEAVYDFAKSIK